MQNTELPEVKERTETKACCAQNVTKGCSISDKVAVADLALQPLRALKMLMDGLATDGVSSLWLCSLFGPPLMMRLFPFDFVYLDAELRIKEAVELAPNVPFPKFEKEVTSALILPLGTLARTGTQKGDQLIICEHEDLDLRLAAIATQNEPAAVEVERESGPEPVVRKSAEKIPAPPVSSTTLMPGPVPPLSPISNQRGPGGTNAVSPSAGFTAALASTWQVASSTTATAALMEAEESAAEGAAVSEAPVEGPEPAALTEVESAPSVIADPPPAAEIVRAVKPAEGPAFQANANAVLALTSDQLSEVVAAAEAAHPVPIVPAEAPVSDERIARSREAWEKATAKTSRPGPGRQLKTRKKIVEQRKDPLGTRVIRWLNLEDPLPERRKIIRLRLEGLEAYEADGDPTQRYEMRDICPTGFCLRTQEDWEPGQLVSLVVVKKGVQEKDHEHRVRVQARVVRCDEDGMGLEFVFPKGTEFHPWRRVRTKQSDETEATYILRELRLSHALGFLRRLCPQAAEEIRHALHERLSNKRVASAVDIVLLAEDALAREGQVNLPFAHTELVMRVIEGGSWVEDHWIRRLWAGLLVSSCTADGQDTSNRPFIELLAKLTPLHLRILSFVCGKAVETITAGQPAKEFHLDCTTEELMEASDWHSFARIQQTVGHLSGYGLFADTSRPSYVTLADKAKMRIVPTALGLKMWARCNGQRV